VAFHTIGWSVQEKLRPRHAVRRRLIRRRGEAQPLGQDQIDEALAYIAIYLLAVVLGMVVFLRAGFTLRESLFEFSSALGTVGLSLGLTKPAMPLGPKLAQILAMLLGRLEFMAVLVTIIKLCGDARDLIHYLFSPKN
jgi:trk system potassium uptake protein TrkH